MVLLLLCSGVAVVGAIALNSGNEGSRRVRVEASSDTGTVWVNWRTRMDGTFDGASENNVASPWSKEIDMSDGDMVTLTVYAVNGSASCRIFVDGEVKNEKPASRGAVDCAFALY